MGKEVKILCYSDLHLKAIDALGNPTEDGLNTRVHRKLRSLSNVYDLAITQKVDYVFDLGDLFDTINPPDRLRNAYARQSQILREAKIRVMKVGGNHETDGENSVGKDISLFSDGSYHVISEVWQPQAESGVFSEGLPGVLFIPEVSNEKICEALSNKAFDDCVIFGHFGVEGATNSTGFKLPGVPQSLLSGRKFSTFLGHIHKRQNIAGDKIHYIGALCRDDFGDVEIETGCTLVTLEYDEIVGDVLRDVRWEYLHVVDSCLYQINIEQDNLESMFESVLPVHIGHDTIFKLYYKGDRDWFENLDRYSSSNMRKILLDKGACKVLVKFDPVSKVDTTDLQSLHGEQIDYNEVIEEAAKLDGGNIEIGKEYLRRAEEKLNG